MSQGASGALDLNRSVIGVGLSMATAMLVGSICAWLRVESTVQSALVAAAAALPAAIAYDLGRRKRDSILRLQQLRRGELQPSFGLTMMLLVAAFFGGLVFVDAAARIASALLIDSVAADPTSAAAYLALFLVSVFLLYAIACGVTVWASARASHYFGDHPYMWTLRAWLIFAAMTMIWTLINVLTADEQTSVTTGLQTEMPWWVTGAIAVLASPLSVLPNLGFALLGTMLGRRRRTAYISAKAERLSRHLEREGLVQPHPPAGSPLPPSAPVMPPTSGADAEDAG
jgi:hypothetical protein